MKNRTGRGLVVLGLGLHTGHDSNPLQGTPRREASVCVNSPMALGVGVVRSWNRAAEV